MTHKDLPKTKLGYLETLHGMDREHLCQTKL